LDESSFAILPSGKRRAWCKACHKKYKTDWKKTEKGKAARKREAPLNAKRSAVWRKAHPERSAEINRKASSNYTKRHGADLSAKKCRENKIHPEKRMAQILIQSLRFFGLIEPLPCESCGALEVQAHHDDHMKPLNVRWLCAPCHGRLHRRIR
jgi:hypothetical protein